MKARARYEQFWFGFEVSRFQIALFRVVFFGLFALDAWLSIAHAPRYGAGDFNAAHAGWLDSILPTPTRGVMVVLFASQLALSVHIALGYARRASVIALAVLYGYTYFVSQLDSYQHRYLLFLLLVSLSFVPMLPAYPSGDDADDKGRVVKSWAARMVLVQMSILYLFAAIAKTDAQWLDGTAMAAFARDTSLWQVIHDNEAFGAASKMVFAIEAVLVVAIHIRKLRLAAFAIGVGMHIGVELGGYDIGIFSYYMFALYLLVLPPRWFVAIDRWGQEHVAPAAKRAVGRAKRHNKTLAFVLVTGSVGAVVAAIGLPLDRERYVIVVALVLAPLLYAAGMTIARYAVMLIAPVVVLWTLVFTTDTLIDHYRFWGGAARRLGDDATERRAYTRLTEVEPGFAPGHRSLGNHYKRVGEIEKALASYRAAQVADRSYAPAYLSEAQVLAADRATFSSAIGPASLARRLATEQLKETDDPREQRRLRRVIQGADRILARLKNAPAEKP